MSSRYWAPKRLPSRKNLPRVVLCLFFCCVFCTQCFLCPVATGAGEHDLSRILRAYRHQQDMYDNITVKARYSRPFVNVTEPEPGKFTFLAVPGKEAITNMTHVLARDGRFIFSTEKFLLDVSSEETRLISGRSTTGFNGDYYTYYNRTTSGKPGGGSIFTPDQSFDTTKPMIKVQFFLDHIFNTKLLDILEAGDRIDVTPTESGPWHLSYEDPSSEKFYDLDMDPKQGFVIVKMRGYWNTDQDFVKEVEYAQTSEGFFYPIVGTLALGGKAPSRFEIDNFELNVYEGEYSVEIPVGTGVTDHRTGSPKTYVQGHPNATPGHSSD